MAFRVGQKVVCVAMTIHPLADPHPGLLVGKVFTVTGVILKPHWITPGLLLAEIAPRGNRIAFESRLFRPAVESKSEISFTQGAPKDSKRFDNRKKIKERA